MEVLSKIKAASMFLWDKKINNSTASDMVILMFAEVVLATYPYGKNLSPEHLLYFIQIVVLWFVLKTIYRLFPAGKMAILSGLLLWGVLFKNGT